MKNKTNKTFTLVELVVVISIIASLLGITLVSVNLAKTKAKHTKWLAYNTMLNKDPDTVLNYNFTEPNARSMLVSDLDTNKAEKSELALINTATACSITGFELKKTHGIIRNATWLPRGGRNRFHHSLYFNGRNAYVEIPNSDPINFDPEKEDFTILTWVNFDNLASSRVICGKAEWDTISQYTLYINAGRIEADVGRSCFGWRTPSPKVKNWHHIALVSEAGKFQIYLDGAPMTNQVRGSAATQIQTSAPLILGAVMTTANKTTPRYFFTGRIDEFILIRKSLKEPDIRHHYLSGKY